MEAALGYAGDALWIVVMAIIASTSRAALRRIPPGVRVPMAWGAGRRPIWRAGRAAAFCLAIGVPLAFGLALLVVGRLADPAQALLVFLVRAATAPIFALAHILWLRSALRTLEDEGAVKP